MKGSPKLFANDIGELWIENEHEEIRDEDLVARFETDGEGWLERAERFVHRCNIHDAIVAALERAEAIIAAESTNRMHRSRDGADPELEALLVLRALLAQSRGDV